MPVRAGRVGHDDRGAAVVEFTLVSILLVTLFVLIMQVGLVLHTRNVMVSAAQEGARFAANADRTEADGVARTRQALTEALGADLVARTRVVPAEQTRTASGAPVVGIVVEGPLPFLFADIGPLDLRVVGHAIEEGAP